MLGGGFVGAPAEKSLYRRALRDERKAPECFYRIGCAMAGEIKRLISERETEPEPERQRDRDRDRGRDRERLISAE